MSAPAIPSPHESAVAHVTGTASYIDDLPLPATALHVATGSSTVAAGRLTNLDLSAVTRAPGVQSVVTAADIPGSGDIGPVFAGDVLLAAEHIEYLGQPIFAVAATSLRAAQQAVKLAIIEIEPLSPTLSIADALAAQSFVLPSKTWASTWGKNSTSGPRLNNERTRITLRGSLYIRGQEHFYLEGQVAVASPDDRFGMQVHSSTQHPDDVQKLVARVLGLDMHAVRVTSQRMGGAFGGKESQGRTHSVPGGAVRSTHRPHREVPDAAPRRHAANRQTARL